MKLITNLKIWSKAHIHQKDLCVYWSWSIRKKNISLVVIIIVV